MTDEISENHIELKSVDYRYMGKGSRPSINSDRPDVEKKTSSSTSNHRIKRILFYPELELVEVFHKSYNELIPVENVYTMRRR